MSAVEARSVTLAQAERLVKKAFTSKRRGKAAPKVPMLWGQPGVGKSELIEGIAASGALGNCKVIDIRLPLMEPTDIRGIPYFHPTEQTMKWAPSEEFPSEETAAEYDHMILFLDELSAAPQSVQAAAYQLMLNRRVGTYVLPDNVFVVAAGNREGDGSVSYKMPQALRNRMMHFEIRVDFNSWFDWAIDAGINAEVLAYLSNAKGDLNKFNARSAERAYATPRSWTFVSDIMEDAGESSEGDLMELVAGTVGEGTAQSFIAYRAIGKDLPTPADILSGKATELKNKEASAAYFLMFNLCEELRGVSEDKSVKAKKFHEMVNNGLVFMMKNFTKDMTVMGARTMLFTYKLPISPAVLDCFDELYEKLGKSVAKAMRLEK